MLFFSNIWFIAIGLFCLGFSVFIHELGHFLAAKKRGLVADRFSIGFGPRLFGWHRNGTDFRISLLPLGGYVSLPQLADMGRIEGGEDSGTKALPPVSYADKIIVAVMGAIFNMIFAIVLSLILWGAGREIIKSTEIGYIAEKVINSDGDTVTGPAFEANLRQGDTIIAIDGKAIGTWMQFQNALMTSTGRAIDGRPMVKISITRSGERQDVTVYPQIMTTEAIRQIGTLPVADRNATPIIVHLEEDMPAYAAGLKKGDRIIRLDNEPVISSGFLKTYLTNHGNRVIQITVQRNGSELPILVKPRIKEGETSPRFGFAYDYPFKTERVHDHPVKQILQFANTMHRTLHALIHRDSDVKVRNMSGPVGIVHGLTYMARSGLIELIWFLALINVNLAIFNLLPIPVLDGGHIMFATISKIIGRPLPRKLMETIQSVFVFLLLGFVLYVSFFDLGRVGRDAGIIKEKLLSEPVKSQDAESADP